ncbi:MAG: signal peptidase I [Nitriliruptorales bacterium]|nr:signal peptidase I [Nitriliruptorales bacterium]
MTADDPGGEPRDIDPFSERRGPTRPPRPTPPASFRPAGADNDTPLLRTGHDKDDDDEDVRSFFRELPVLLLIAFGLAFILRTFVIQVFYIPSSSMEDTLAINDRIVVEKLSYRLHDPERGDIIVFEGETITPVENGAVSKVVRGIGQFIGLVPANAQDFVKRVIGVPGDHIEITEGRVVVNGVEIDEPYVSFTDLRSSGPFDVPEGKLFVLGDNRPNSSDSRFGLGFIDIEDVVGRAFITIWPFDRAGSIHQPDYGRIPDADSVPVERTPTPGETASEDG